MGLKIAIVFCCLAFAASRTFTLTKPVLSTAEEAKDEVDMAPMEAASAIESVIQNLDEGLTFKGEEKKEQQNPPNGIAMVENPPNGNAVVENPPNGNAVVENPVVENPPNGNAVVENPPYENTALENPPNINGVVENPLNGNAVQENPSDRNVLPENPSDGYAALENPPNGNAVAFYAYLDHSVSFVTFNILIFNRVVYNAGNGYNQHTGVFTVPEPGTYILSFHFENWRAGGSQRANLYVDSNIVAGSIIDPKGKISTQAGTTIILYLTKGQSVFVKVQNGEVYGSNSERYTVFTGALLAV